MGHSSLTTTFVPKVLQYQGHPLLCHEQQQQQQQHQQQQRRQQQGVINRLLLHQADRVWPRDSWLRRSHISGGRSAKQLNRRTSKQLNSKTEEPLNN